MGLNWIVWVPEPIILNSAPIIWKLNQGDNDLGAGEEKEWLGCCSEFFILHFTHFYSVWRDHITETVQPVTLLFLPVGSTQGTLSACHWPLLCLMFPMSASPYWIFQAIPDDQGSHASPGLTSEIGCCLRPAALDMIHGFCCLSNLHCVYI